MFRAAWASSGGEGGGGGGGGVREGCGGGGITAAVAQHTLQSLNTAGLHNEAPSPTECACVCVCLCTRAHSAITDVQIVAPAFPGKTKERRV